MDTQPVVRRATNADAVEISRLVQTTVRISNAGDYSPAVVERVARGCSVQAVEAMLEQREVLVACDAKAILGTASLEGNMARTVFVLPEKQGRGIGRLLMVAVEGLARDRGLGVLRVPASLTARSFYRRLGYLAVEEMFDGEERTILMEKALG